MSITLQAKDGITITSDSDGVVKIWDISTGLCKASFQTPAKGTCMRDVQLINDRLILIWYANGINIWDVERGELTSAVSVPPRMLKDLKISGDGSRVFSLAETSAFISPAKSLIQAWSVQTGESVGKVEFSNLGSSAVSLIVDGSRVWAHYTTISIYEGWDFGTPGSSPAHLPNIPPDRLHPNGVVLWDTSLSQIKYEVTGEVVFQLPKRYGKPIDVQWNGQYLVACFRSTEVLILDFSHILEKCQLDVDRNLACQTYLGVI
jgi:WD40 repeat protein